MLAQVSTMFWVDHRTAICEDLPYKANSFINGEDVLEHILWGGNNLQIVWLPCRTFSMYATVPLTHENAISSHCVSTPTVDRWN